MNPSSADILISILIEITAILGLVFNCFGFLIVWGSPKFLANNFGRLCLNHCIANFGACLIFLLWITPMTLTQETSLATGLFGKIIGQVNTFFWDVTIYSHVVVSVDRMISVAIPVKSTCLLRLYHPVVLVAIPWIWAFLSVLQFFYYDSCYDVYHPDLWLYSYADTKCGQIMPRVHFVKDCVLFTGMFMVDMVTLYFLRKRHNILRTWSVVDDPPQISRSHRRSEIRFFAQARNSLLLYPVEPPRLQLFEFQLTLQILLYHLSMGIVSCSRRVDNVHFPIKEIYSATKNAVDVIEDIPPLTLISTARVFSIFIK